MRFPLPATLRGRLSRQGRPALAMAVLVATAATLSAVPATAATQASSQAQATARTPDPITAAAQQAHRTGKPVTLQTMTSPTSLTQVLPDGEYRMTTASQPVRAWTSSGWQNLSATLTHHADGTWSPAVSSTPVTVSGGGTGPLVTMTTAGRSLSVDWPGTLPSPQVSGDTALYRSVLPGVDLEITVSDNGGFRDVLIVRNKAAAVNPALRRLALTTETTGGLQLSSSADGALQVGTAAGAPAFTASRPLMWDSAATAAMPARMATGAAATAQRAAAATATVGASTAWQPGRRAHAAWIGTSLTKPSRQAHGVTRQSLALVPDSGMLTSPATVYPVYVDPWLNSPGSRGWYASTNDLYPGSNYYDKTADPQGYLQLGCNGQFCARTYVQMLLKSSELKGAQINSAHIQFTQANGGSCTASTVELSQVGGIPVVSGKPFADWTKYPALQPFSGSGALSDGAITSYSTQYAYPGGTCGTSGTLDFNITSFMQAKGPAGPSSIDFGLTVPSGTDSNPVSWRELSNASGAITMTTTYDHAPNADGSSVVSPGGTCQSTSAAKTVIGDDDFTMMTVPSDPDSGALTVTFVVRAAGTTTNLISQSESASSGVPVTLSVPASQAKGWHTDGATKAYQYSWYTYASDGTLNNQSDTGTGSAAHPCLFTYDPSVPQAPGVSAPQPEGTPVGPLGGSATFTLGNCTTVVETTPTACAPTTAAPAFYVYQVNDGPYKKVAVSGTTQSLSVPLTQIDDNTLTVSTQSTAGNMSPPSSALFSVSKPATPYTDGDYAGTGHPDLITVGDWTEQTPAGLWMSESDGAGHLTTIPVDIGAQGNGLGNSLGTNDPPSDWTGTTVMHGDFTGNGVQDIVDVSPSFGTLQMIDGPGAAADLSPESGNTFTVSDAAPIGSYGTAYATDVVAAGDASGLHDSTWVPSPDLITIDDSGNNGYALNLYSVQSPTEPNFGERYGNLNNDASNSTAPDGSAWGANWVLQTAQPGGQTVLIALNTTTGVLWESTAATASTLTTACPDPSYFLVGMACSTWTKITGGPWTASTGASPALVQADVNAAGLVELWTIATSAGTATPSAWTVSGSALTLEATNPGWPTPSHAWPLSGNNSGTINDTETETASGTSSGVATVTTTADSNGDNTINFPAQDNYLGTVADFTGNSSTAPSYVSLPAGLLQDTTTSRNAALQSMTLTLRFKSDPGEHGILVGDSDGSLPDPTVSPQPALSNNSAPILYIATDGHLYGQFPSGHLNSAGVTAQGIFPMESANRVDDGLWHTVTLVADGAHHDQILYLDNDIPIHIWANGNTDSTTPATIITPGQTSGTGTSVPDHITVGAGIYSNAGWVNADGTSGIARASYYTGSISDVAFYPATLAEAQLPHQAMTPASTTITSNVLATECIDNTGGSDADGNKVQIYACNGTGNQSWTFNPHSNTAMEIANTEHSDKCLTVTNSGTANSTLIETWTCNGAAGQWWQLVSNGALENPASGKCIDDPGGSTADGTQVDIYNCSGAPTEVWATTFHPAVAGTTGPAVSESTGLCVQTGGAASGTAAKAQTCNGTSSQQLTYWANGTVTTGGLCLTNNGGSSTDGNTITFATCSTGATTQIWAHKDNGSLMNYGTSKCLQGGAAGSTLQLYTCSNALNQTWIVSSTYAH